MMQHVAQAAPARPPPPELVPVQLTLCSKDWVLWPVASTAEDLADFSEGLVLDLGMSLSLRRAVADTVRKQVADWVAQVPPPACGPGARRELIR